MSDTPEPPPVARLELKAALLLVLLAALVAGAVLFLLYARGAFERTETLYLEADDAEGVRVGSDLTFAGFPIGRVAHIELIGSGKAQIAIEVPEAGRKWLRPNTIYTMVRSVVGGTSLRAYTTQLAGDPLKLPHRATVLSGDATAELPRLIASARDLLDNLNRIAAPDSALVGTLGNVQELTERMKGPRGALGVVLGDDDKGTRLNKTIDRANTLLAHTDALVKRLDGTVAKADAQVLGPDGVLKETRATVVQVRSLLEDARGTLQRVDTLLQEATGVAGNVRKETADLGPLRAQVEDSLRKVEALVDEVNRKWPFARDRELKLK